MVSYYVIIFGRDVGKSIFSSLNSVVNQTIPPNKIIAIDDGSSDNTLAIMLEYQKTYPGLLEVTTTGSKTRDYKRLPSLWNLGLRREYDYHMILAADATLPLNYSEELLVELETNPNLVIISGGYGESNFQAPLGGGRFVRQSFFYKYYKEYPTIMGYESEILERAFLQGHELKVRNDIKLIHHDKLGHSHNFSEFGRGMRSLGYYPPYALARCIWDFVHNHDIGKLGSLRMLYYYLTFIPDEEGYYSLFPADIRHAVSARQKVMFTNIVLSLTVYKALRVIVKVCHMLGIKNTGTLFWLKRQKQKWIK